MDITKEQLDIYLNSLTMYHSDYKIRMGNKLDGGYIISDAPNLQNYGFLLSAGVGGDIGFEKAFIKKYNVNCVAFDGTEGSGHELCRNESRINYVNKNLGINWNDKEENWSNYFQMYDDIIVKMDIEGHEWQYFKYLPDNFLIKIKQMSLEFHYPLNDIENFKVLQRLANTHYLIHFHVNNSNPPHFMFGKLIPSVFECTYVRKDMLDNPSLNVKSLPTILDNINVENNIDYSINCEPWVHSYYYNKK